MTGTIIETAAQLRGKLQGGMLVFPGAKGSSGWSNAFHMTRLTKSAPLAMIFNQMTTKIALGAVVTRVPADNRARSRSAASHRKRRLGEGGR